MAKNRDPWLNAISDGETSKNRWPARSVVARKTMTLPVGGADVLERSRPLPVRNQFPEMDLPELLQFELLDPRCGN